jgi:hypothetical protein
MEIQGRPIRFPVRIGHAVAASAVYLVRTGRAAPLVAGSGLRLVSVAGRTPLVLLFVDYRVNDLGDYDEVGVALLARHRGRIGVYVHQLPVTQPFTMEAGRTLWGLPKWLARAELSIIGPDATCHLADETGRHVLTAALRTLPWRLPLRLPTTLTTLAPRDGEVLASRVSGARGSCSAPAIRWPTSSAPSRSPAVRSPPSWPSTWSSRWTRRNDQVWAVSHSRRSPSGPSRSGSL